MLLGNRAHHTRGASGHDHSGGACLIRRCLPQGVAHKQGTPTQERTTIGASGTPARAALASQGGACHIVLLRRWVPQPERTTTRQGRAVTTARAALAYLGGACHNGRRHPFRVALATRCCSEEGTPTRARHTKGEHYVLGRRQPLGRRLPQKAAPSSPDGPCHQVLLRRGYPSPQAHLTARERTPLGRRQPLGRRLPHGDATLHDSLSCRTVGRTYRDTSDAPTPPSLWGDW